DGARRRAPPRRRRRVDRRRRRLPGRQPSLRPPRPLRRLRRARGVSHTDLHAHGRALGADLAPPAVRRALYGTLAALAVLTVAGLVLLWPDGEIGVGAGRERGDGDGGCGGDGDGDGRIRR